MVANVPIIANRTSRRQAVEMDSREGEGSDVGIDLNSVREYWTMFESEPSFQIAAMRIKTRLLGSGVVAEGATDAFRDLVSREFTLFAASFVDQVLVQGFCVYRLSRKGDLRYPVPVDPGVVTQIRLQQGRIFVHAGSTQCFVYRPGTRGGGVSSVCRAVNRMHSMLTYLETLTVMTESRRAEPSVLLETNAARFSRLETDLAVSELDGDVVRDGHSSVFGGVDQEILTRLQAQQILAEVLDRSKEAHSQAAPKSRLECGRDPHTNLRLFGKKEFDESRKDGRFVVAPHNTRIREQFAPPAVRNDVIEMRKRFETAVRELCGVPSCVDVHRDYSVDAIERVVADTVSFYARQLQICFADIISLLHRNDVNPPAVSFTFPSLLTFKDVQDLQAAGILTDAEAADRIRHIYNLKL